LNHDGGGCRGEGWGFGGRERREKRSVEEEGRKEGEEEGGSGERGGKGRSGGMIEVCGNGHCGEGGGKDGMVEFGRLWA